MPPAEETEPCRGDCASCRGDCASCREDLQDPSLLLKLPKFQKLQRLQKLQLPKFRRSHLKILEFSQLLTLLHIRSNKRSSRRRLLLTSKKDVHKLLQKSKMKGWPNKMRGAQLLQRRKKFLKSLSSSTFQRLWWQRLGTACSERGGRLLRGE